MRAVVLVWTGVFLLGCAAQPGGGSDYTPGGEPGGTLPSPASGFGRAPGQPSAPLVEAQSDDGAAGSAGPMPMERAGAGGADGTEFQDAASDEDADRTGADVGAADAAAPDAGVSAPPPPSTLPPLFPPPSTPATRIPSPNNAPQCPATAPDNPIGSCLGLPVYLQCSYGTYQCICDWYHWICLG